MIVNPLFTVITGRSVLAGMLFILLFLINTPTAAQPGKTATVAIPPAPEMYSGEPQPLNPAHCGVCHTAVYRSVKDSGVRHRFACQKCHNVPEAHNLEKVRGKAALKPKCTACHDKPHGRKVIVCVECHSNAHTPKKLAAKSPIVRLCFECHGAIRDKLVTFKSRHSNIPCITCHTSHGFKPSCFTCHKPHQKGQVLSTCQACHPAHMPRQIQYGKDLPSDNCGYCHVKIYSAWENGLSKHKAIPCATCHKNRHRTIPACTDCHTRPHSPSLHKRFPNCLTCHIDVHDMPASPSKSKQNTPLKKE